jgi:hypothetical protein
MLNMLSLEDRWLGMEWEVVMGCVLVGIDLM